MINRIHTLMLAAALYSMCPADLLRAQYNTALGSTALLKVLNSGNTAVGFGALAAAGDTKDNTAIGLNSCSTVTTGSHNSCLGWSADVSAATAENRTVLGYNAKGAFDNS